MRKPIKIELTLLNVYIVIHGLTYNTIQYKIYLYSRR